MIKNKAGETIITWQMLLVVIMTSCGIYASGIVSGYFYFRAESLSKADARDKVVDEIKRQVDQLPTQQDINQAVKEDERK